MKEKWRQAKSAGFSEHQVRRTALEPVGLRKNRLQTGLSVPYFAAFLAHRHDPASLSRFFALAPPSQTGSWEHNREDETFLV